MTNYAMTTHFQTQRVCYAVKVRTRREEAVGQALRRKGFDTLLPTYVHRKRYSDRIKVVNSALFPGYIFVRMHKEEYLPIASTDGVHYIVKTGNTLQPLAVEEATALESLCNLKDRCEPCAHYSAGQQVSIESGLLQGLNGILVRVGDNDRLVISINSIFSSVSVDLQDTVIKPRD